MALSRAKYRRLPDLYVAGKEVVLKDGTVMWLQVLNPFEIDEARHDAQVARSRLVMALQQLGSDEIRFVESQLWQDGIEEARKRLVQAKTNQTRVRTSTHSRMTRRIRLLADVAQFVGWSTVAVVPPEPAEPVVAHTGAFRPHARAELNGPPSGDGRSASSGVQKRSSVTGVRVCSRSRA